MILASQDDVKDDRMVLCGTPELRCPYSRRPGGEVNWGGGASLARSTETNMAPPGNAGSKKGISYSGRTHRMSNSASIRAPCDVMIG